jgi:hypothetical protein
MIASNNIKEKRFFNQLKGFWILVFFFFFVSVGNSTFISSLFCFVDFGLDWISPSLKEENSRTMYAELDSTRIYESIA